MIALQMEISLINVNRPSVQFSCSVVSDSLRPHESQHARPPCPSPTPGVHSNSGPSSRWCHPTMLSSVVPFSSCPQSLPASESFPMSQLFAWGGQSTGVSALASVLPKNTQGWSPSEWTGWISLQSKGLSRVFSNTTVPKHQFFGAQPSSQSNSHIHTWPQEKNPCRSPLGLSCWCLCSGFLLLGHALAWSLLLGLTHLSITASNHRSVINHYHWVLLYSGQISSIISERSYIPIKQQSALFLWHHPAAW